MNTVLSILQGHPDWPATLEVLQRLTGAGHQALVAGGSVRDALRGLRATDLDVATSASPDEVIGLFAKTVAVGKAFGVVRVLHKGADLEVATFRRDGPSTDSRRPDSVEFSDRKNDALRRDFTVNALFYDPQSDQVIDDVGGLRDLDAKILRTVGPPERRFDEDRLRILRALGFSVQLDFQIEPSAWQSILARAADVRSVSQERIRDELSKLLQFGRGAKAWRLLQDSGLLKALYPDVSFPDSGKVISLLSHRPVDRVDGFARLFVAAAGAEDDVFDQLKLSRSELKSLQTRLRFARHPELFEKMRQGEQIESYQDSDVRAGLDLAKELGHAAAARSRVESEWLARQQDGQLPKAFLRGDDVKSHLEGPGIRDVLREAYYLQLEGVIADRQAALTWFQEWMRLRS